MAEVTPPTIRIFISSPGDVADEREGARRVVEGLKRLYPNANLEPVLWEQLALPMTASFQETIDYQLDREPIDIAVFILWSRLGSPLTSSIRRPDGALYRSGTERELDLMLAAYEQSGRRRPIILAYVRDDDLAFREKMTECPAAELEDLIHQRKLAESFIRERFHDKEGRNIRAYLTYREPVGFVRRLRLHLRQAVDDLLGADAGASWQGPPYRGLEVFDIDHAPIFHGRDEETCEVLQRLRQQERSGCSFVVIVGASGAGKSSLARAGVAASLVNHAGDDDTKQWRELTFVPTLASEDLLSALVDSIASAMPELSITSGSLDDIARELANDPTQAVQRDISPSFVRACQHAGGRVRLLLILDQMEELWTDRKLVNLTRERFMAAIEALARSGHIAVLATLRSDFYPHAQQMATFVRLKGTDGHYDLLTPDSASLQRLIAEPARLAGLRLERSEQRGRSLESVILQDAQCEPGALPLLQYALTELYQRRDERRSLLTFEAYERIGGVVGALERRANQLLKDLPPDAQGAFEELLPLLVTVDVAGEQSAVRRRARVEELTSTPLRKPLVEQLTAARFLTTDRRDGTAVASLAHEALLTRWDRVRDWIELNREHLRRRARVEHSREQWEQQHCDESLLLTDGLPLDEGQQLVQEAAFLIDEGTADYIRASVEHHRRQAARRRKQRTMIGATISVLLVTIVLGAVLLQRGRRASEAKRMVNGLLQADTSRLETSLDDLKGYRDFARADLLNAWTASPRNSNAKLHAGLALVAEDDSYLPFLLERFLSAEPDQVEVICKVLVPYKQQIIPEFWPLVESADPKTLLHAASALAVYDVENDARWMKSSGKIAEALVRDDAFRVAVWRRTLSPARRYLVEPLSNIYREKSNTREPGQIDMATELLREYVADDLRRLVGLLLDAEPKQFATLFDVLAAHGEFACEMIEREQDLGHADTTRIKRLSNAVTALLRLGQSQPLVDAIGYDLKNPELMTQFVHRCRECGVSPTELWSCLEVVENARQVATADSRHRFNRILYGLLLSLGEFDLDEFSEANRQMVASSLIDWYENHPSSAVHGATGWLLRKWGFGKEVLRIDRTPIPFDESYQRDWYVVAVDTSPERESQGVMESILNAISPKKPRFSYFTMIVFPPREFVMGAPEDEPDRQNNENLHRVNLTRPLAVSDREVTWEQFNQHDQAGHHDLWEKQDQREREPNEPVHGICWFEAVAYCRWLTRRKGIPESSQCYASDLLDSDPDRSPKWWIEFPDDTQWPVNLEGRGFRLLTEAEWENACRSGTQTAFSFGDDRKFLDKYGWCSVNAPLWSQDVGLLRPNARGLFDMHGNVREWCHDFYTTSAVTEVDPVGGDWGSYRVNRGGGWGRTARSQRSAYRGGVAPSDRTNDLGFRIAIVPSAQSPKRSGTAGNRADGRRVPKDAAP